MYVSDRAVWGCIFFFYLIAITTQRLQNLIYLILIYQGVHCTAAQKFATSMYYGL